MDEIKTAKDALKLALRLEKKGYEFYMDAAKRTKDPKGKEILLKLAKDEIEHKTVLKSIYKGLEETGNWIRPEKVGVRSEWIKIDKLVFPEKGDYERTLENNAPDYRALETGIEHEEKSHRFYLELAKKINDPNGKVICERFAEEEMKHRQLLEHELECLMGFGVYWL